MRFMPIDLIDGRADQPRRRRRVAALEELTASVRDVGVLQPIRVRPRGERYEIIAGERRWRAASLAGLGEVPVVVVERDDDESFLEAVAENVHREDLSLIDRAEAIHRLRAASGLTSWAAVAVKLGISRVHLHRLLNVSVLPREMRDDSRAHELVEKHVRALVQLRHHPEDQRTLWNRIFSEALTGEQALSISRELTGSSAQGMQRSSSIHVSASRLSAQLAQLDGPSAVGALQDDLRHLQRQIGLLLEDATPPSKGRRPSAH
jgi:ParB family transcriptional regulator, chromosome partitioning protein